MKDPDLLARLTPLIGRECIDCGQRWRIVDLLPDEGLLVLESTGEPPTIQLDQFGRASHRAPELRQIPVFRAHGSDLSQELQALLQDLPWDPASDLLGELAGSPGV